MVKCSGEFVMQHINLILTLTLYRFIPTTLCCILLKHMLYYQCLHYFCFNYHIKQKKQQL